MPQWMQLSYLLTNDQVDPIWISISSNLLQMVHIFWDLATNFRKKKRIRHGRVGTILTPPASQLFFSKDSAPEGSPEGTPQRLEEMRRHEKGGPWKPWWFDGPVVTSWHSWVALGFSMFFQHPNEPESQNQNPRSLDKSYRKVRPGRMICSGLRSFHGRDFAPAASAPPSVPFLHLQETAI